MYGDICVWISRHIKINTTFWVFHLSRLWCQEEDILFHTKPTLQQRSFRLRPQSEKSNMKLRWTKSSMIENNQHELLFLEFFGQSRFWWKDFRKWCFNQTILYNWEILYWDNDRRCRPYFWAEMSLKIKETSIIWKEKIIKIEKNQKFHHFSEFLNHRIFDERI